MSLPIGDLTTQFSISPVTYAFTATGTSGGITISGGVNASALERGQSIFLGLTSASSNGYTKNGEYFVIPVSSGAIRIASTKENALTGTLLTTASGNAGAGTIYPNYQVGGMIYVGTSGNVNLRGYRNKLTGTSSFNVHKSIEVGTIVPIMVKDISASGTTAGDIIAWND